MQRIEVVQDPECDAAWPEAILNILTVQTSDGREHTATVPYYTGHFKKPMSDADIEDKFRRLASGLLDESHQQTALDRLVASRRGDRPWSSQGIARHRVRHHPATGAGTAVAPSSNRLRLFEAPPLLGGQAQQFVEDVVIGASEDGAGRSSPSCQASPDRWMVSPPTSIRAGFRIVDRHDEAPLPEEDVEVHVLPRLHRASGHPCPLQ